VRLPTQVGHFSQIAEALHRGAPRGGRLASESVAGLGSENACEMTRVRSALTIGAFQRRGETDVTHRQGISTDKGDYVWYVRGENPSA
jgi:hypothetical protein